MKKNTVLMLVAVSMISGLGISSANAAPTHSEVSGGSASVSAWIYAGLLSIYGKKDDALNYIIDVPVYGEAFANKFVVKNPASSLTCEEANSTFSCQIDLSQYSEKADSAPGGIFESLARAKKLDPSIRVEVKEGAVQRHAPATSQDYPVEVQETSLVADDGLNSIRCVKTVTKDVWTSQPEQAIAHRTYTCKVY